MRPRRLPLLLVAVVAAASLLHEPVRALALSILRGPFTITSALIRTLLTLPRLPELSGRNAALETELARQSVELAEAREALRRLRAAEEFRTSSAFPQGLVASVISRSPIPGQQTIVLNRGRQHGLQRDTVLVDGSGVVGRVIELYSTTSTAMLVNDPDSRIAGLLERSREAGLLVGQGSGVCKFIYLDADADVVEGDRIVTAGLGGVFRQKGLWLGTVIGVVRDREAGATTALVRPAAKLGRLEEVLCLIPSSS